MDHNQRTSDAFILPDGSFTTNPILAAEEWAKGFYIVRDALERIYPVPLKLLKKQPVINLDEILAECDNALKFGIHNY